MFDKSTEFGKVKIGQHFIEETGNHSVIYERVPDSADEDGKYNARLVKPGKTHFYFFRDDEAVRVQ